MQYRVSDLMIYPSKGLAGVSVTEAMLSPSGLSYGNYADHQFMVASNDPEFCRVNSKNQSRSDVYCFVTQRDKRNRQDEDQGLSVMALIKPVFDSPNKLKLVWQPYGTSEPTDSVDIPYDVNSGKELRVSVWDYETYAVDQGNLISEFLSDCLNLDVRFVKAAGKFQRVARQNYMASNNRVYFHDAYPVHWFPKGSVYELIGRAGEVIPWESFRPQIVIDGMQPQYEHKIHEGRIAGIPFFQPKPCDRCPVTLVDPQTGHVREKRKKQGKLVREPLWTLMSYKIWINKDLKLSPIFGENMNPQVSGLVRIGDKLEVISERNPPLDYGPMNVMAQKLKALKASRMQASDEI